VVWVGWVSPQRSHWGGYEPHPTRYARDWSHDRLNDMTTASSDNPPPLLEVRNVTKRFPGVKALQDVSLHVNRGEVLAVIGENGAGKSTLMKILAGVQEPDVGEIRIDGQAVRINSVETGLKLGVSLIHQELNLADNLDIGANIYLGREPRKLGVFIDRRQIDRWAVDNLRKVGLDLPPRTLVRNLPIGRQQMVEIAKALSTDARVLIMDEPTSSLTQHETDQLFRVVKSLRDRGISIVYISHRLSEVKELADRVTVLRDGKNAGEIARADIDHERMVKMMVGRDIAKFYERIPHTPGAETLHVTGLRTPAHPKHELNFSIRAGEIVGMAGLVGAGRTELLTTLFGVTPALAGEIRVAGNPVVVRRPMDAITAGVALVPEDRKEQGLVLEMPVRENISLPSLKRDVKSAVFLNYKQERAISAETVQKLNVKTPNDRQIVQYLSGGNQQKVVIGKWLAMSPKVLLLDEPTRGVDVGAKQEIYRLMVQLAANGVAILFVSSDLEEVLNMSDRTLVMHEGRITGELAREQLSEEAVMHLATGGTAVAASIGNG
jgi:ribose transport system ATP-binding protein